MEQQTSRVKQPNSLHCFVCGVENSYGLGMAFYEVGPGQVEARYTVPERYQGYPGVVHGGIIAAMLDEVVGRATMVGENHHFMVTAKLQVHYRKPVPIGQPLRLTGHVVRRRGRLAVCRGELWLPDGTLGAEAEATLADYPGGQVDPEQLEALGWKVYPDEE